jgi:hypothetical protein
MLLIAQPTQPAVAPLKMRFWIDPAVEAALAVHIYEREDGEVAALRRNGRRADAAPELVDCYNCNGH